MTATVPLHGLHGLEIGDVYSIHVDRASQHNSRYIQIEHDRPLLDCQYRRGMRYGYIGDPGWHVGTVFTVTALTEYMVTIEDDPALRLPEGM